MKCLILALTLCLSTIYASDIEEKLYAVHATDFIPKEGYIRAGFSRKPFTDPLALSLYPDLRDTVHFALGEVAREIKLNDGTVFGWEERKFAIVTPLKSILPQLINLNTYDTFTLGSVSINDPAFMLVIPETALDSVPANHTYEVWTYDPKVDKIRQAVSKLIQEKGGWGATMTSDHFENELSPAILDSTGQNINTAEFFASFKNCYPYISIVGLRWDPYVGEGYLFGVLETKGLSLVKYLLSGTFEMVGKPDLYNPQEFESKFLEVCDVLQKVDQFVKSAPYTIEQKREYEDKRFSFETWLNIFAIEMELNQQHKTLRGAPRSLWEEIDGARSSYTELHNVIFKENVTLEAA